MAGNRIRSNRPELLEHPNFAGMSDGAVRLWLGLQPCWDDEGRSLGSVGYVAGRVYFARTKSKTMIGRELAELEAGGWLIRYEVAGVEYLSVRGWSDPNSETYQYIKAPRPSKLPAPTSIPGAKPYPKPGAKPGAKPWTTDQEQEQEQEREEEKESAPTAPGEPTATPPLVLDPVPVPSKPERKPRGKRGATEATEGEIAIVMRVLSRLAKESGHVFTGAKEHVRLIVGRLRDGITEGELHAVIAERSEKWKGHLEMHQHLVPETLFGPEKIQKYLPAARAAYGAAIAEFDPTASIEPNPKPTGTGGIRKTVMLDDPPRLTPEQRSAAAKVMRDGVAAIEAEELKPTIDKPMHFLEADFEMTPDPAYVAAKEARELAAAERKDTSVLGKLKARIRREDARFGRVEPRPPEDYGASGQIDIDTGEVIPDRPPTPTPAGPPPETKAERLERERIERDRAAQAALRAKVHADAEMSSIAVAMPHRGAYGGAHALRDRLERERIERDVAAQALEHANGSEP